MSSNRNDPGDQPCNDDTDVNQGTGAPEEPSSGNAGAYRFSLPATASGYRRAQGFRQRSRSMASASRNLRLECPHPSCPARFDRPSALKQHFLVHTGEKPHRCDACDACFSIASNLRRHLRTCPKIKARIARGVPHPPSDALTTSPLDAARNRALSLGYEDDSYLRSSTAGWSPERARADYGLPSPSAQSEPSEGYFSLGSADPRYNLPMPALLPDGTHTSREPPPVRAPPPLSRIGAPSRQDNFSLPNPWHVRRISDQTAYEPRTEALASLRGEWDPSNAHARGSNAVGAYRDESTSVTSPPFREAAYSHGFRHQPSHSWSMTSNLDRRRPSIQLPGIHAAVFQSSGDSPTAQRGSSSVYPTQQQLPEQEDPWASVDLASYRGGAPQSLAMHGGSQGDPSTSSDVPIRELSAFHIDNQHSGTGSSREYEADARGGASTSAKQDYRQWERRWPG